MVRIEDVLNTIGKLFPWELGEDDGISGVLQGNPYAAVRRILFSVFLTPDVIKIAEEKGFDALFFYDSLIPLFLNRKSRQKVGGGDIFQRACELGITLIGCKKPLEEAQGGMADILADVFSLSGRRPIVPSEGASVFKIVVFVPHDYLEAVSKAMADAGAGRIGDYEHCGFRIEGFGTFLPGSQAKPFSGEVGKLNVEREVRLEMVVPSYRLERVLDAIIESHPYEEVAYDVYKTENSPSYGAGRVGNFREARPLSEVIENLSTYCGKEIVFDGNRNRLVQRMAVLPDSAFSLVPLAFEARSEVLVAGEVSSRDKLEAEVSGVIILEAGYETLLGVLFRDVVSRIKDALAKEQLGIDVEVY